MNNSTLNFAIYDNNIKKIKKIIEKESFDINHNKSNLLSLSIINNCQFLFDFYLDNNVEFERKDISMFINLSIKFNNQHIFTRLIHKYDISNQDISIYVNDIAIEKRYEILKELFSKKEKFHCYNFFCIRFCLISKDYKLLNILIKHISNINDLLTWINEINEDANIDKESVKYLEKLIKINNF
jgi:hypothetical protein